MSVPCRLGGPAPCLDDMCHAGDRTLCGLILGLDFCVHEQHPDFCDECNDFDDPDPDGVDYDAEGRYARG